MDAMRSGERRFLRRICVGISAFLVALLAAAPVHAQSDLNCADFGTRERAQIQFESTPVDIHGLDADGDGKACEWNGSTGWWVWPIAGAALVAGRTMARRRIGDHQMVPGAQGIAFNYEFSEDGQADKVLDRATPILLLAGAIALPLTTVLRDHVFPRSATPIALYLAIGVLFGTTAYVATLRMSRRDLYVVDSTSKDEGEL